MPATVELSKEELTKLQKLRSYLKIVLRAISEMTEKKTRHLVLSGKKTIAQGAKGIPLEDLWGKLGVK